MMIIIIIIIIINAVRNGGSGAYVRRSAETTSSLSIPAGDLSSNYRAEVHALKAATELLIEEDCNQQNIVLLSDSLSALQSLTNGPTDLRTQQLHNSLRTLSNNNRVVLLWVPAHVGIAWNETADRLAKAAAKLPQPHLSTSYNEVKTLLKQKQKSAWRLKNNGYDPQKDQINTLDRRAQTTIFRLRTGHCGLRKYSIWRDWVLLIQPTVNVALRSRLLSTFFRPAHTWRQYANSFGQKTLKWAPSSGGKLPNYRGWRTS